MAQFYDEVKISIQSGKGGDGAIAARKDRGTPMGGPAGGNGGNGGSIIFVASKDENTLLPYRYRKIFKADAGEAGRIKDQFGANAKNTYLTVPVGTIIRSPESKEVYHQFTHDKEERVALEGGEWWKGNLHFKDAILQYPNFCLLWEPFQKKDVILELQLLADVALIGTPSVGKSSLINAISHTKAKVAEYPFTTLIPNLWSVTVKDYHFNVIDIPGLIQWAAEGRWLGNTFLRHILKSRIFCLIADAGRFDTGINEIPDLLQEIILYIKQKEANIDMKYSFKISKNHEIEFNVTHKKEIIFRKKILILINKYDLINDEEIIDEYKKQLRKQINTFLKTQKIKEIPVTALKKNTFVTSAFTHFGLDARLEYMSNMLQSIPKEDWEEIATYKIIREAPSYIKDVTSTQKKRLIEHEYISPIQAKYSNIWETNDKAVAKLVYMTRRGKHEGEMEFWKKMEEEHHLKKRHDAGIQKGDIIKIISPYNGTDDRFILY